MGLFDALNISGSGLTADRLQMDVTSENLANAQTTRTATGGPYQRQQVVLQEIQPSGFQSALEGAMGSSSGPPAGGVQVAGIVNDPSPPRLVYEPGNPDANAQGYVAMPNVNPVTEMVDLISASRNYEANVTAMQTTKSMYEKSLTLLS
jgi:flagellar basal-body rod protein FlgC